MTRLRHKYKVAKYHRRDLIEEERVGEVLHVGGDGELALEAEVQLPQASLHLVGQRVHPLALLGTKLNFLKISNVCHNDDFDIFISLSNKTSKS